MPQNKPLYTVGCVGHIHLERISGFDDKRVRAQVGELFAHLTARYRVRLLCGLADGADRLFAEEALANGVSVVAVLPDSKEQFAAEHQDPSVFWALLAQCAEVMQTPDYLAASRIIAQSDILFAIWDGIALPLADEKGNPIHLGGTYHTILQAQEKHIPIRLFGCE